MFVFFAANLLSAQISRDDLERGDTFDNNVRIFFPSTAEEAMIGFKKEIENINFYKDLKLKGNVKKLTQQGSAVVSGKILPSWIFSIIQVNRPLRITEKNNFIVEFNTDKMLISLNLSQPTLSPEKAILKIENILNQKNITQTKIFIKRTSSFLESVIEHCEITISYTYNKNGEVIQKKEVTQLISSTGASKDNIGKDETTVIDYEFDSKKRIVSKYVSYKFFNEEFSKPELSAKYNYDQNGKISSYKDNWKTLNFVYNKLNRLMKIDGTYPCSFTYDGSGKISKKIYKLPQEEAYDELLYYYGVNDSVQQIVTKSFQDNNSFSTVFYTYNNLGDIISEERNVSSNISDIVRPYKIDYIYKYDKHENWIERTEFLFGEMKAIIKREISYY